GNLRTLPTNSNGRSNTFTVYGLNPGQLYSTYWSVRTASNSDSGTDVVRTKNVVVPTAGAPSWVSAERSESVRGQIYVDWGTGTDANYYIVSTSGFQSGIRYTTGLTVNFLQENTQYYITVTSYNVNGQAGGSRGAWVTTKYWPPPYASAPNYLSGSPDLYVSGRISLSWSQSYDTDYFRVIIPAAGYESGNIYGTSATVSGLAEGTGYLVYVYAYNNLGQGGGATTIVTTTKFRDTTAPYFNSINASGDGNIYVSFSAADSGSGLRPTSTYYIEISNANGTTYGQGAYTTNRYRTFTTNGQGGALINGSTYRVRVTVYDNEGNSATTTTSAVYKQARPEGEWSWHSTKTSGQPYSLTAAEWNSFCTRINQFRIYKGHGNYTFTPAANGQPMRALQINEARTAINTMTSIPNTVTAGYDTSASYINNLRTLLESIN
ncbi:MAG: hypothetical protein ABS920_14415, partial [Sporosarcina sp.]